MSAPGAVPGMPRGRWWVWPAIIVGMLLTHVVLILTAISIATSDRSFQVIPNAYVRGTHWDERKAQLNASASLGWKLDLTAGENANAEGNRDLVVKLRDREGRVITDANVEVRFFHPMSVKDVKQARLVTNNDGTYAAPVAMSNAGFWEFEIRATRGADMFFDMRTEFVAKAR